MGFIIQILITSGVILLAARIIQKVEINSFGSALLVAFLFGILNPTIGFVLSGILHLFTLGIPLLIGLGFIIRLIASAIVIKLVDAFVPGFKVYGFTTALLLALIIALTGTLTDWIF